jgi:hypothetical protein
MKKQFKKLFLDILKKVIIKKLSLLEFDKIVNNFFRGELFRTLKKSLQKIDKLLSPE